MTKFELNNKLVEHYGEGVDPTILPMDDWDRLMSLASENDLSIELDRDCSYVCRNYYSEGEPMNEIDIHYDKHPTPQDAIKFAIAEFLIKLKE